jgi:hypothetical protein
MKFSTDGTPASVTAFNAPLVVHLGISGVFFRKHTFPEHSPDTFREGG